MKIHTYILFVNTYIFWVENTSKKHLVRLGNGTRDLNNSSCIRYHSADKADKLRVSNIIRGMYIYIKYILYIYLLYICLQATYNVEDPVLSTVMFSFTEFLHQVCFL